VFEDPSPARFQIRMEEAVAPPELHPYASETVLEVWLLPGTLRDQATWRDAAEIWMSDTPCADASPPVAVRCGEIQITRSASRAIVSGPEALLESVWKVLLDFAHYEGQLRNLEQEIRSAWPGFEEDIPLAYDVNSGDLKRDAEIAMRAGRVLQMRMRLARIEPHLDSVSADFTPSAAKLAGAMREAARCEERLAYADGHLEALEYVYEMASQRMGEFRNARGTLVTEAIIIGLLAAEVLLMTWELLRH
jgi:hypothetical protein